jgi:hypothetical protein
MRLTGTVIRSFIGDKGYAFLRTGDGQDEYFMHVSELGIAGRSLKSSLARLSSSPRCQEGTAGNGPLMLSCSTAMEGRDDINNERHARNAERRGVR